VSHGVLYNIVSSACDLIGVLADLGSHRCHGIFCTRRGLASRVLLGACAAQGSVWWHLTGTGLHSARGAPQCLGWWHRAGDGRTRPEVTEGMCSTYPMS
jgi:hypothetical protein